MALRCRLSAQWLMAFMAQGMWPKAYGLWHLALGHRLLALGIELWWSRIELLGASSRPPVAWKGSLVEPLGAKWPLKTAKEDPKGDTARPKVSKTRPHVYHKAPSSGK